MCGFKLDWGQLFLSDSSAVAASRAILLPQLDLRCGGFRMWRCRPNNLPAGFRTSEHIYSDLYHLEVWDTDEKYLPTSEMNVHWLIQ